MKRLAFVELCRNLSASMLLPTRLRPKILRLLNVRIGHGALIMNGVRFNGAAKIEIGDNVFINRFCYFDANAPIIIEADVLIGDHVKILTGTHEIGNAERRGGAAVAIATRIGVGSWIGSGATILPGANVADGCVIGASGTVTRITEKNGLYIGCPARRVRELN